MKKGISAFAFGKGQKRGSRLMASTALTAAGLMALVNPAYAVDDFTTPVGENVVGGAATFDRPELGQLNIHQSTDRVIINWDSFNIGKNGTTQFYQPGTGSIAVNRVMSKGANATQILGTLKANGRLVVLDRNGVFFGPNSKLDVGGIIASTGNIDDNAFMNGDSKIQFHDFGDGSIINEGLISAHDAGLVAFVGKNVANNGIINAKVGKVALAAGDTTATLDLYGDGLVEFAVDDAKGKVLASNSGTINAEGGTVAITANAAKDVVDNVINMSGVVNVSSVSVQGGKIILGGGKSGKVTVSGKLNASGKNGGGKIDVKGKNIDVAETAEITSNAIGNGNGGNVDLIAEDHMDYRGVLVAKGGELGGNGGNSEISGYASMGYSGNVDLTAAAGETGSLLLDPAFAVIHSGAINNPLGLGYLFSADALANTLKTANTTVQATNFIDVGVGFGSYNTGIPFIDNILNFLVGAGNIDLSASGLAIKDLTLKAATVNVNKDVKLGSGKMIVDGSTINLGATIYKTDGTTQADDAQLVGNTASVINVKSNAAKIQQAISFADRPTGATINIAKGTYVGPAINVNKDNLTIKGAKAGISGSDAGRDGVTNETIIDPNSPGFLITGDNTVIDGLVVTGATEDGIVVDGADNVTIKNSIIHDVIGDGIFAKLTDGLKVFSNKIYDITSPSGNKGSGVQVQDSTNAMVGGLTTADGNVIYDTGWDGVRFFQTSGSTAQNNDIDGVSRTGVYAGFGANNKILSNWITDAGRYGVNYEGGSASTITGNDIDETGLHGIKLLAVGGTNLISGNHIDTTYNSDPVWGGTGGDGIHADAVSLLTIDGNFIGLEGGDNNITGDGIFVTNTPGAVIKKNEISETSSTELGKGNGIHVKDALNVMVGGVADADGNIINNTGLDGIRLVQASKAQVRSNKIGTLGAAHNINGDGIYGFGSGSLGIFGNTITNTTSTATDIGSGVQLIFGQYSVVGGTGVGEANTIYNTGWDGVRIGEGTFDVKVIGNDIDNVHRTGVYLGYILNALVQGNSINGTETHYGVHVNGGSNATVDDNEIDNTNLDGVFSEYASNLIVKNNDIDNTGRDGIRVDHSSGAQILTNEIGLDGPAHNINGDGIYGFASSSLGIFGNTITNTTSTATDIGSGVQLIFGQYSVVGGTGVGEANTIYNTGWDGVRIGEGTFDVKVIGNDIDNVHRTGVYLGYILNALVQGNSINGTETHYGVHVDGGANATVDGNDIDNTNLDGVYAEGSDNTLVQNNYIDNTGRDGVRAKNVSRLVVDSNFIGTDGGNINGDGVFGIRVGGAIVKKNEITGTLSPEWNKGSGVHIQESAGVMVGGTDVSDANIIHDTAWDGVRFSLVSDSTVQNNDIDRVARTGVYSGWGFGNDILSNLITGAGRYGINYDHGINATISGNDVDNTGLHGIQLIELGGTNLVSGNHVDTTLNFDPVWGGTGGDGIHAENISNLTISGNFIGLEGPIAQNGIFVDPSPYVQILNNQVNDTGENGIYSLNNDGARITGNTVTDASWNGILAVGGHDVRIGDSDIEETNRNTVTNSGINGIEVDGTTGSILIRNNVVTNSGTAGANGTDGDGIQVHNIYDEVDVIFDKVVALVEAYTNSYVEIVDNIVDIAKEDGIDVHDVRGTAYIARNNVTTTGYNDVIDLDTPLDYSGHDGISVQNVHSNYAPILAGRSAVVSSGSYDVLIVDNNVDTTEDDGIEVVDSGRTLIQGNNIYDVGQNATYSEVDGYGADGIHVRNVYNNYDGPILEFFALEGEDAAPFGPYSLPVITNSAVDILGNNVNVNPEDPNDFIGNTADDGIQVLYSGNTVIDSNHVANSGFVGEVPSEEGPSEEVFARVYEGEGSIQNKDEWGADGIHVLLSNPYSESKVSITEDGPYYYGYGDSADITNNFVDNSADDGIDADYVHYLTVDTNDVDVSGNQGIEIVGSGYGYPMDYAFDDEPEVDQPLAKLLGLYPGNDWTAIVTNNIVNNSEKNGIKIKDYDYIEASDNTVSNSGKSGLLVTGSYNGNVNVEGNTFTDNKTGATFRSGLIDLTGRSNTFNNGEVGLKFSPIETYITIGDSEGPGVFLGRSFLQLVDDDAPGVQPASDDAPISNFGGTIGAQIFNNQSLYFVELKNGAFYKPGTPTWLNGVNSTYTIGATTITPSSNALTPSEWAFLEPMFRDWNDGELVGRFWGQALSLASIDQQNIFEYFDPLAPLGGEVSVVMLGLPRLTAAPGAGPTPFNPNAIEPAAGGDEAPVQTASLSPEELNNIQTAAGGDDASNSSCWSDASANAAGGVTTFSFSSVVNQTTLAQDTTCGQ